MDDGYKQLASAVIRLAWQDATAKGKVPAEARHTARAFLSGGERLELWATLADLEVAAVLHEGRRLRERAA